MMTELCSVCMVKLPTKLTPLFTKTGDQWQSTGLSEMLEIVLEVKILNEHKSVLAVCTKCIYKISKLFHDNYSVLGKNTSDFFAVKISVSVPALQDELKWAKFKCAYCVLVDKERANAKKKFETTDESEVRENKDYINYLPLECIAKIFVYLSHFDILNMEKVCQRWKDASEIAWGSIKEIALDEDFFFDCESDEAAEQILSRCGQYLEKIIFECSYFDASCLLTANLHCQNLKTIVIRMESSLREKEFINVFFAMRRLKKIHIICPHYQKDALNLKLILSSLTPGIEKIKIVRNYESVYRNRNMQLQKDFTSALWNFRSLKSLSLAGVELNKSAMDLITCYPLVELKLVSCEFHENARVKNNIPHLKVLKYINNNDCYQHLLSFIKNCKNLKKLTLRGNMSGDILNELRNLKQLEHLSLYITYANNKNLIGIFAESFPNLKHLELQKCYYYREPVGFKNLAHLKNLEHLSLREMEQINDDHLSSIVMKLKKLKYLDLYGCTGISNSALQKLGNLTNLEYLNIEGIRQVDDSVISSIKNNCMKLKKILRDIKYY